MLAKNKKRKKRYSDFLLKLKQNSQNCLSFHTSQLTELYQCSTQKNLLVSNLDARIESKFIEEDILGIVAGSLADTHLNNAGSPYIKSDVWSSETKEFEIEIIEMWAKYFGMETNQVSGYVTSGSTEGNMACINWHIIYFKNQLRSIKESKTRDLSKKKRKLHSLISDIKTSNDIQNINTVNNLYNKYFILNEEIQTLEDSIKQIKSPILYATQVPHSHYSISKIASLYKLDTKWVNSNENGSMNLVDFENSIKQHTLDSPLAPAIININIGTTMTGAIDNAPMILKILKCYPINYSIHLDAAMLGAVLKFINPFPNVTNYFFELEAKTIVVSGHKFLGTSQITGIACAEKDFLSTVFPNKKHYIGYTGNLHDITISGSRSGFNIMLLHNIMSSLDMDTDYSRLKKLIQQCFNNLEYLKTGLINIIGRENIILLPNQFNILFIRPSDTIQKKYSLMPVIECYSSIIVTAKVTKEKIDTFLSEYKKDEHIISKLLTT
tara:strand:+ start:573 stop:2060 length:1488 start_codon:yes stop_codon:yes gene_type:complete